MSARFHLNDKTGLVSACDAKVRDCPFGETNHFDTPAEARSAFETVMRPELFVSVSRQTLESFMNGGSQASRKVAELDAELKTLDERFETLDKEVEERKDDKTDPRWFQLVQERRKVKFRRDRLANDRLTLLPKHLAVKEAVENRAEEKPRRWSRSNYEPHPEITIHNEDQPASIIATWTDTPVDQVKLDAETIAGEKGITLTEAYREIWAEAPIRTDRKFVMLDFETASSIQSSNVDLGSYSQIIETGWLTRHPDGSVEENSSLHDVDEDFREVNGTGYENVHGISVADLEGRPKFIDDPSTEKLMEDLRGSVLVAHAAHFEVSQLRHHHPEFAKLVEDGEIQVIDTKNLVKWFVPQAPDLKNESLVEAAGLEYEDAHRALSDAKMTWGAVSRLKGIDSV